jgi:hypothetical protein
MNEFRRYINTFKRNRTYTRKVEAISIVSMVRFLFELIIAARNRISIPRIAFGMSFRLNIQCGLVSEIELESKWSLDNNTAHKSQAVQNYLRYLYVFTQRLKKIL